MDLSGFLWCLEGKSRYTIINNYPITVSQGGHCKYALSPKRLTPGSSEVQFRTMLKREQ